ncbi:hypothetical protein ORV05_14035 [Amycolatopsis cynarae]|uniref:Uncharacterized protein n=1 Tax=Amycolatopsis cynarae TaxID=2995223 RepID=A0ABY7BCF6_9PSEU|nr:hypothetical protein [Amycolatopsis sp. HUAS 11-8]WAL68833.1 hypothetical protein ORV05_14035 [Amycolatopsis sp. HUAS 11-8]
MEQVLRRVDSLAASGMVLGYPPTGRITALSREWETAGEQIEMTRDGLLAAMAGLGKEPFSFQYWLTDTEDEASVICLLSQVGADVVVEDYSLDGFGGPVYRLGQNTVIRRILAEFRATPSAVGLIVDRWGESKETDLDDIVTGGPTPVTIVPELLVLRPEVARLHPELPALVPFDGFLACDTDGILALAG